MEVLWAVNLWEEGVPVKQHSYSFDDEHACPKKFPKVQGFRRHPVVFWMSRVNASKLGKGNVARGILCEVVVGGLAGRHSFGSGGRGEGWGCFVLCCLLIFFVMCDVEQYLHIGAGSCLAGTNFVKKYGAIWEPQQFVQLLYKLLPLYESFWPV